MKLMPSKEFRRRLGEVLAGDETVVITNRGKRVAIVVPLESDLGPKVEKLMRRGWFSAFAGIIKTPYPTNFAEEIDDVLYGPVSQEATAEGDRQLAEGFVPPRLVAEELSPSAHPRANSAKTRTGRRKPHREEVPDAPPVV